MNLIRKALLFIFFRKLDHEMYTYKNTCIRIDVIERAKQFTKLSGTTLYISSEEMKKLREIRKREL